MAKIKCEINEDSTLVKFEAVEKGEVFVCNGEVFVKVDPLPGGINAIRLDTYSRGYFSNDTLVTYVKSAELKLTI